jgi:hypothetical protein
VAMVICSCLPTDIDFLAAEITNELVVIDEVSFLQEVLLNNNAIKNAAHFNFLI